MWHNIIGWRKRRLLQHVLIELNLNFYIYFMTFQTYFFNIFYFYLTVWFDQ